MNKVRRMLLAVLIAAILVCFGLFVAACNGTETYTVTVVTAEHGTVALAPEAKNGKYEKGTEITATVTPDTGYAVDTFTVGGENKLSALSGNAYKFKVEKDTEIKATFKTVEPAVETHTVTVVNMNEEGGTVSLTPTAQPTDNVYTYNDNTDITVTLTANEGYHVKSLKVAGATKTDDLMDGANGSKTYTFTLKKDTTVEADFEADKVRPSIAVMFIIDNSGSMGSANDTSSPLYYAKEGAIACLDTLTERDYVGIMTPDPNYAIVMNLTPVTERSRISEAIRNIGEGGMTVYSSAIDTAGERLLQLKNVDKRHIVMVSDGYPGDNPEDYIPIAQDFYVRNGITLSFVGVGVSEGDNEYQNMLDLVEAAGGTMHTASSRNIGDCLINDITTIIESEGSSVVTKTVALPPDGNSGEKRLCLS